MVRVSIALFNNQNGGRPSDGRYDVERLQWAFSAVDKPPGSRNADAVPRVAPRTPAPRTPASRRSASRAGRR